MLRNLFVGVFLALAAALIGCAEDGGDIVSTPGELTTAGQGTCPTDIQDLIVDLFPAQLENPAIQQCQNMQRSDERGNIVERNRQGLHVIGFAIGHFPRLEDPNGGDPPTKEEALVDLVNAICAFLGCPFVVSTDPNFGFGVCDPAEECVIVNNSGLAGIMVPPGSLSDVTLITFAKLPDTSQPFPGFMAYPFLFDFDAFSASMGNGPSAGLAPAQEEPLFDPPAIVGVCVVEQGDLAPPDDVIPFLQLAHFIEETEEVELLPIANADFLSDEVCAEATTEPIVEIGWRSLGHRAWSAFEPISEFFVAPLWASPGKLGGAISAFSPVGAVDNRGEEEPETGAIAGTVSDGEGPIQGAFVELWRGGSRSIRPSAKPIATTSTDSSGRYEFRDLPSSDTPVHGGGEVGEYTVRVLAECYDEDTEIVTVTAGDTTIVDFVLNFIGCPE